MKQLPFVFVFIAIPWWCFRNIQPSPPMVMWWTKLNLLRCENRRHLFSSRLRTILSRSREWRMSKSFVYNLTILRWWHQIFSTAFPELIFLVNVFGLSLTVTWESGAFDYIIWNKNYHLRSQLFLWFKFLETFSTFWPKIELATVNGHDGQNIMKFVNRSIWIFFEKNCAQFNT